MRPKTYNNVRGVVHRRIARVKSVDGKNGYMRLAVVMDVRTKTEFSIPLTAPHRVLPQVGDLWAVTAESGEKWRFDYLISATPAVSSNLRETMRLFNSLGMIQYSPEMAGLGSPMEAPHAAYIGEVRLFHGPAPQGWLPLTGGEISRVEYWRLFELFRGLYASNSLPVPSTSSTTFTLPYLVSPLESELMLNAYSSTSQTNPVANAVNYLSYPDSWPGTTGNIGLNTAGDTMTFSAGGIYNIQFSAQLSKTDAGSDDIDIWLVQNGSNLDSSNTRVTLSGNHAKQVAAWNWFVEVETGDTIKIAWSSPDTDVLIYATGTSTSPSRPAIPSVILTVSRAWGAYSTAQWHICAY